MDSQLNGWERTRDATANPSLAAQNYVAAKVSASGKASLSTGFSRSAPTLPLCLWLRSGVRSRACRVGEFPVRRRESNRVVTACQSPSVDFLLPLSDRMVTTVSATRNRLMTSVGNNVRILRSAKQLSQSELATACGVARATINRIERGQRMPDFDLICKIADALGVKTDGLRRPLAELANSA